MLLSEIDKRGKLKRLNVVLLQTPSELLEIFVEDRLKAFAKASSETSFKVDSKKSLKEVSSTVTVEPFGAEKWFVRIDLDKVSITDISKIITENSTSIILCTVSSYQKFKKFKDIFAELDDFLSYYISYLKSLDVDYIYETLVPKEYRLDDKLYTLAKKRYSSDVDVMMKLIQGVSIGQEIRNKDELTECCGLGGATIDKFIIGLLTSTPQTAKGLKTVIKNKFRQVDELQKVLNWDKTWQYSLGTVRSISDIKMLYIGGDVYKSISRLPKGYDEKRLSKYNRYLDTIKKIPFSRILQLKSLLEENKWSNYTCFEAFIYKYMTVVMKDVIKREDL